MLPGGLANILGFGLFVLLQQIIVCENYGCASKGILMSSFRVQWDKTQGAG